MTKDSAPARLRDLRQLGRAQGSAFAKVAVERLHDEDDSFVVSMMGRLVSTRVDPAGSA